MRHLGWVLWKVPQHWLAHPSLDQAKVQKIHEVHQIQLAQQVQVERCPQVQEDRAVVQSKVQVTDQVDRQSPRGQHQPVVDLVPMKESMEVMKVEVVLRVLDQEVFEELPVDASRHHHYHWSSSLSSMTSSSVPMSSMLRLFWMDKLTKRVTPRWLQRFDQVLGVLQVAFQAVSGLANFRADVMWCSSKKLRLVANPVDVGPAIFIVFSHEDSCRALPTDLHKVCWPAVAPKEAFLSGEEHDVGTGILPKQGSSELLVSVGLDDGHFGSGSSGKFIFKGFTKMNWSQWSSKKFAR